MHAETPRLADKTIVFSEHEVSPKNITFNYKIINSNSPNIYMLGMLLYVI
jgi:hypothetical protein